MGVAEVVAVCMVAGVRKAAVCRPAAGVVAFAVLMCRVVVRKVAVFVASAEAGVAHSIAGVAAPAEAAQPALLPMVHRSMCKNRLHRLLHDILCKFS